MPSRNVQQMPDGTWVEIIGNQIRPLAGPNPDQLAQAQQYAQGSSKTKAALMGLMNATGGGWMNKLAGRDPNEYAADMQAMAQEHPWAYIGGNIGGAIPAAIGTGGMGIPAQITAGAALGVLGNAQDPLQGALFEGTAAGLGGAIGKGIGKFMEQGATMSQRVTNTVAKAKGVFDDIRLPGVEPGVLSAMPGRTGKNILRSRVAGSGGTRVAAGSVADEFGGQGQYLAGMLTPDELAARGIQTTQGDAMALLARNQDEIGPANIARAGEELRRTDPTLGSGIESIRGNQKEAGGNYLKEVLGIDKDVALTPNTIADNFKAMGREFDQFADDMGSVPIGDDVMEILADLVDNAPSNYSSQLSKLYDDVDKMIARNQGQLAPKDFQGIRTRLGKMMDAGKRQGDYGKINDAAEFQEALTARMESGLGEDARAALANLRRRYAVSKTLNKGAAVSPGGEINPATFVNNWKKGGGLKNVDDITRTMNTLKYLQARTTPSSGTAERLLANPGRLAIDTGKIAIPAGAGTAGLSYLLSD